MDEFKREELIKVPLGIKLRDEFDTYEEFDNLLKELSKRHFVNFWKRDCRTVEGAKKKTDRFIDPKIKYYQLKYACVHGGRMFRKMNASNGNKKECAANFYLIATPNGNKLYVKSLNDYHNHEISEATYLSYFVDEKLQRGRPKRSIKRIKQDVKENDCIYNELETKMEESQHQFNNSKNYYHFNISDEQHELSSDNNISHNESAEQHELSSENNISHNETSMHSQDQNTSNNMNEEDIDLFLKYLGSEMKQIKNRKVVKNLKRKFISMIQKAQDDEDSC